MTSSILKKIFFVFIFFCVVFCFNKKVFAAADWVIPQPQIKVPTMEKFTAPDCTYSDDGKPLKCQTKWIAQYISGIYKYAVSIVGIVAVIVMMFGGVRWILATGNASAISEAKAWIASSFTGLILVLTSYIILYTVNPSLIGYQPITLDIIKEVLIEDEEESVTGVSPKNITTFQGYQINGDLIPSLNSAQNYASNNGVKMKVASGYRDIELQKKLIEKNCGGNPPTKKCEPPTCLLKNGAASCPHTSGAAIDIWGATSDGKQAITLANCRKDLTACRNNPYQKVIIEAMKGQGFCVLSSEPWHFEKPKMSSACN